MLGRGGGEVDLACIVLRFPGSLWSDPSQEAMAESRGQLRVLTMVRPVFQKLLCQLSGVQAPPGRHLARKPPPLLQP